MKLDVLETVRRAAGGKIFSSFRQAGYMSPSWMNNLILKVYFKAAHQVVSLPTAASQPSRQSKIERNDFLQMFDKTVSGW